MHGGGGGGPARRSLEPGLNTDVGAGEPALLSFHRRLAVGTWPDITKQLEEATLVVVNRRSP
jgi:hypothetical protein